MNEFPEDIESKLQKMIGLEDVEPDFIVEKSNFYVKEVLNSVKNQKRKFKDDDSELTGTQDPNPLISSYQKPVDVWLGDTESCMNHRIWSSFIEILTQWYIYPEFCGERGYHTIRHMFIRGFPAHAYREAPVKETTASIYDMVLSTILISEIGCRIIAEDYGVSTS